jgi:hypothetical protein
MGTIQVSYFCVGVGYVAYDGETIEDDDGEE